MPSVHIFNSNKKAIESYKSNSQIIFTSEIMAGLFSLKVTLISSFFSLHTLFLINNLHKIYRG